MKSPTWLTALSLVRSGIRPVRKGITPLCSSTSVPKKTNEVVAAVVARSRRSRLMPVMNDSSSMVEIRYRWTLDRVSRPG